MPFLDGPTLSDYPVSAIVCRPPICLYRKDISTLCMESFIAEMKGFVESIQENTIPPVTGIDGCIPVVIGMAAKKSYLEKRPVALSEIG